MEMDFKELQQKYPDRDPAFPSNLPEPNEADLNDLIVKYNCRFPPSFIEFQLRYCKEIPMGDVAFEGFGFANKNLESYMNLEEVLQNYKEMDFPEHLTPFKQENGDFWCFDNRSTDVEFPVVLFDHNSNKVETDLYYQWENFIDWLDKTMEEG